MTAPDRLHNAAVQHCPHSSYGHPRMDTWLARSRRVLLVAIGGGGDAISSLPLAWFLQAVGKKVSVVNIHCIDNLPHTLQYAGASYGPACFSLSALPPRETRARFSEFFVAALTGIPCYSGTVNHGARALAQSLTVLMRHTRSNALACVDGGTDCLAGFDTRITSVLTDAICLAAIQHVRTPWIPLGVIGACADREMSLATFNSRLAKAAALRAFCGSLEWDHTTTPRFRRVLMAAKRRYTFSVSETIHRAATGRRGKWRNPYNQNIPIFPVQSRTFLFDARVVASRLNPFPRLCYTANDLATSKARIVAALKKHHPSPRPWASLVCD